MKKLALSDEILLSVQQPARYIGGEVNMVVKDPKKVDIRFAMCFPDVYEIGMSHLGIQILYSMFNSREDIYCERVYSPWMDLDPILREKKIPLFTLESQDPVKEFDFLGITLQYEMCYTNVLQILDLSQIPLRSCDRGEEDPIVIGGGPCAYNPEPLADFFDLGGKKRYEPECHRQDQPQLGNQFPEQIQKFVRCQDRRIATAPHKHSYDCESRHAPVDHSFHRHRIAVHKKQDCFTVMDEDRVDNRHDQKQTGEKPQIHEHFHHAFLHGIEEKGTGQRSSHQNRVQ